MRFSQLIPDKLYRGIHKKGSGDVVSAVCYTIYITYLSLCTKKQLRRHLPKPFREFPYQLFSDCYK